MKIKVYSQAEVDRLCKNAYRQGIKRTQDVIMSTAIWAALDVLDVKPELIQGLMDFMADKCRYILDGEVTLEDIQKMIRDETGVEVHLHDERR